MLELEKWIKMVAEARRIYGEVCQIKKASYDEWEKRNTPLIEEVKTAEIRVKEFEDTLRNLTLQAYAETGDKAPAEGVGIRERTVLTYDGKVAFDWAKAHKMALKLDTKAFEKIVKADTPDFVKVSTEAIATIATELKVE